MYIKRRVRPFVYPKQMLAQKGLGFWAHTALKCWKYIIVNILLKYLIPSTVSVFELQLVDMFVSLLLTDINMFNYSFASLN